VSGRVKGKVAVITGGASGIGAATAAKLVAEGAYVILGDIQQEAGDAMAASLGPAAHFQICDVTRESDVQALVDAAISRHGKLDIMFNNAGIVGAIGPMESTPAEEWKLTLDILLNGVFYGMKHASRVMKKAGSGSIISMSSVAGVTGGLGPHAYCAAKHAVVGPPATWPRKSAPMESG
jgi:NAD(P)-dependent dehydrogenase (short-subunit alcohol dehydrogenase family)